MVRGLENHSAGKRQTTSRYIRRTRLQAALRSCDQWPGSQRWQPRVSPISPQQRFLDISTLITQAACHSGGIIELDPRQATSLHNAIIQSLPNEASSDPSLFSTTHTIHVHTRRSHTPFPISVCIWKLVFSSDFKIAHTLFLIV